MVGLHVQEDGKGEYDYSAGYELLGQLMHVRDLLLKMFLEKSHSV